MRQFFISGPGLIFAAFLVLTSYYLWSEHKAHIMSYLPLILALGLCLGMHFFMHRRHEGHGSDKSSDPGDNTNGNGGRVP